MKKINLIIFLIILLFMTNLALGQINQRSNFQRRNDEIKIKEEKLIKFLADNNLDAVILAQQKNIAWLTAGGDIHVVLGSTNGSAILYWSPKEKYVIVANNEKLRIMQEELKGLDYQPLIFNWHDSYVSEAKTKILQKVLQGKKVGADFALDGTELVTKRIAKLRYSLTKQEIERYSWLSKKCTEIVENTCRKITPGMTEEEIQSIVSADLLKNGIVPTVLLIATDDRIYNYKHAITKSNTLKKYAMVNICAQKWGLITAITRFVHFGQISPDLEKKQEQISNIYATILSQMEVGRKVSDIFSEIQKAYKKEGFAQGWLDHHQGGAIGYSGREYKAYAGCDYIVQENQAFAWNPTLKGVKVEDTILVGPDNKITTLTKTKNWPYKKINIAGKNYKVPQILIRTIEGL